MREQRNLGSWEGLTPLDEFIDGLHQRLDGAVRVVAGDVVVEPLPQPLDDVRLRRSGSGNDRSVVAHAGATGWLVSTAAMRATAHAHEDQS